MSKRLVGSLFAVIVPSLIIILATTVFIAEFRATTTTLHRINLSNERVYSRPPTGEVYGFAGSAAKYHRSPCPALNALANHGYLPRLGKNVTSSHLQQILVLVYNLDATLAEFLVSELPDQFTLSDLSQHNWIEHDASLVHTDSWQGEDPSQVNTTLANRLFSLANEDHHITKSTLAAFRREREASSAATTPNFEQTFTFKRSLTTYSETAAMILVIGDYETQTISVEHARSFLLDERIPDDYERPKQPVTLFWCMWLTLELKIAALISPLLLL